MNDNEFWFSVIMIIGVIVLVKTLTSSVMYAVKTHYENRQYWGKNPRGIPPMFQKMTDKAMADRDELIESLRERIEVLEKIVTDEHKQTRSSKLSEEIDNLKG
jgi:hypothetical protein